MAHWGDSATAVYVHVCVCASFTCFFLGLGLVSFKQHLLLHVFVVESFTIGRRTWSEVYARSRQLCSALKGRGISRGDVTWHFRWKTDPKCQHLWSEKIFEWWMKIKCIKRTETQKHVQEYERFLRHVHFENLLVHYFQCDGDIFDASSWVHLRLLQYFWIIRQNTSKHISEFQWQGLCWILWTIVWMQEPWPLCWDMQKQRFWSWIASIPS